MKTEPDVLIAGAGPTGLALACGLLANGVTARVVDKAVEPAGTSRALGLQPRGIEVVDRLGALDSLPERALQVGQIVVHINGRRVATVRVGQPTALVTRPSLVISQAEVEAALRRRVTELGGEIVWDREVTAAEQDSHGVVVGFADGGRSRAGWLVGCDGAHSRVRRLAGIGFPGVPFAERFLLVDVDADLPLLRNSIYVWFDRDSVFGAFPLPGRDLWRLMAPAADPGTEADRMPDEVVLAEVARRLWERTGCAPSLIRDPKWVTSFRIHRRLAETYRDGRILLAGDAAHVHSPFGGQGMNTGIGDAENLAWKLAMVVNETAGHELLDSYEAERRPVAAKAVRSTGVESKLVLGNHVAARLLRDRVVVPLMGKASTQRRVWESLSQLKVTYRNGPLGRRARGWFSGRGPLPGDRVPDIECVRAYGDGKTTLHAELGSGWALVLPASMVNDGYATVGRMVCDRYAAVVARRLGDDGFITLVADHDSISDVMLVRPDAHLGWRGPADLDALERWLSAVTGHGQSIGEGAMSTSTPGRAAAHTPEALHTLLEGAFNHGDIDALVQAYEEDAVLVVPPAGRSVSGRDNIRAAAAPLVALAPYFTSVVQKALQTDGMALTYARWELVGAAADGRPVRLSGRGTMVSRRRRDGTWGIVLDDPLSPGLP